MGLKRKNRNGEMRNIQMGETILQISLGACIKKAEKSGLLEAENEAVSGEVVGKQN